MSYKEELPKLPSTEETKLGNILKELSPEVQDVHDSILHISNRYRSDLTSQLDQSLKFQQHLSKNFVRLSRKTKRLYQNSENLNTSLNKKLDQFKPCDDLEPLTKGITDSVFGILDSLNQIEMILPYNERLGVQDSPHRAHYPNLYKLLNPEEDESTIREDEIEGFEQLDIEELQDFDGDGEESEEDLEEVTSDIIADEEQNEDDHIENDVTRNLNEEENTQELASIRSGKHNDEGDDTDEGDELKSIKSAESVEEEMEIPVEGTSRSIHETEFKNEDDSDTSNTNIKGSEDTSDINTPKQDQPETTNELNQDANANKSIHKNGSKPESDDDDAKREELESVIDNYKTTRSLKNSRSQSIRSSFRPISAAISIPSPSSAGITNITASTSTSSGSDQVQGTIVGSSSSNGTSSVLADNLKKYMKS
ncbi:Midasin [Wickerhamomyces ciferrii]|uniref:Midasin n=1 Tax=Wickerhamomyces ciferrii (strain ATCC 14091 / BCRC 22168 / CBS 111 / JCM 3599 / NBRC 0793 / NRRL Y-1031 F-60-10) TaxID=1206466 RepID=K0KP77_WICCF|nr:Midasin [Wickerhamomyces ciferrii]CCH43189.1 Midasin [Wickerhamomyces ciferrii]